MQKMPKVVDLYAIAAYMHQLVTYHAITQDRSPAKLY